MLTGLEFAEFLEGGFGSRVTFVGGVIHAVAEGPREFPHSGALLGGECRIGLNF